MNLIILEQSDRLNSPTTPETYQVSGPRAKHINTILKAKKGDSLRIGLLNGQQGNGHITNITTETVTIQATWQPPTPPESPIIDIICALPRPQTLKKVLQSAATMGVRNLHLIRANRVEKSYFHSPLLQPENLKTHLIEGLSQGRRTQIPQVSIHQYFKKFFQDQLPALQAQNYPNNPPLKLLPDLASTLKIPDILTKNQPSHILLTIGPEGGWVPFEEELMEDIGFKRYNLGPWTLRVENALVAAISQLSTITYK